MTDPNTSERAVSSVEEVPVKRVATKTLGDFTPAEFAQLMSELSDVKRYKMAQQEAETSEGIWKDARALAAGTPFRVSTEEDLNRFYHSVLPLVRDRSRCLVLAVATIDRASGAYLIPVPA